MLILCICFATTMAKFKPSDGDIYSVSRYKPIVEQGVKLGQEVVSFKNKTVSMFETYISQSLDDHR